MDDHDIEIAAEIASLLRRRTLVSAESCTAGRIAATVACVEHATDFLRGGIVAYQMPIKQQLLGLGVGGALSTDAVEQMARGACELFGADVSVSTSGVAGETAEEGVRPGTVFVGTCIDGVTRSREHHFGGEPQEVCAQATTQALADLLDDLRS
jgi:nicotinamide-nucleotide amidase